MRVLMTKNQIAQKTFFKFPIFVKFGLILAGVPINIEDGVFFTSFGGYLTVTFPFSLLPTQILLTIIHDLIRVA